MLGLSHEHNEIWEFFTHEMRSIADLHDVPRTWLGTGRVVTESLKHPMMDSPVPSILGFGFQGHYADGD